jgi:hypothetical protein
VLATAARAPVAATSSRMRHCEARSYSEIAATITSALTRSTVRAASSAAPQPRGPSGWLPRSNPKTVTARQVSTRNSARLKASLVGAWRRCTASAAADPTRRASTSSAGDSGYRPVTSGSSLRAKECAWRRNSRWTANTVVAAKPAASTGQGS